MDYHWTKVKTMGGGSVELADSNGNSNKMWWSFHDSYNCGGDRAAYEVRFEGNEKTSLEEQLVLLERMKHKYLPNILWRAVEYRIEKKLKKKIRKEKKTNVGEVEPV